MNYIKACELDAPVCYISKYVGRFLHQVTVTLSSDRLSRFNPGYELQLYKSLQTVYGLAWSVVDLMDQETIVYYCTNKFCFYGV